MTGRPTPLIVGLAGRHLSRDEAAFLAEVRPAGIILFARNVDTPDQVRALILEAKGALNEADPLVLIDQEGGRVARLRPPVWRRAPAMARFGQLYANDPASAEEAAWLNARLLADDLHDLGVTVDCVPVLDLPTIEADAIISDRAFSSDPDVAARLGRATMDGLSAGGVLPVVKHIPGHGRATVDSHKALPRVMADIDTLARTDFQPFAALADAPVAMTAHIVYTSLDAEAPATCSQTVIDRTIRRRLGFRNLLLSDDLEMAALVGELGERAEAALSAGCDLALHCSGDLEKARATAAGCPPIAPSAWERLQHAKRRRQQPDPLDRPAAEARLNALLGETKG